MVNEGGKEGRRNEEVGSGGRAVERRTVNRGDGGSIPPTTASKLRQFRLPHICLSFGRDTKSRWFLLSGVYARGSKRSHTGGKCVTCSGLTNCRGQLLRQPKFGLFGGNHLRTKKGVKYGQTCTSNCVRASHLSLSHRACRTSVCCTDFLRRFTMWKRLRGSVLASDLSCRE